jgi:hypothetical protein
MIKKAAARQEPAALKTVMLSLFMVLAFLLASGSSAIGETAPSSKADPMIKITSLPIKQDLEDILPKISADVARDAGLDEKMVTYYWQTFKAIYCPGCKKAKLNKPIFVDMYVPGFMTEDEIKKTMTSLAAALERYTDYTRNEVFIYTHIASKGQLYIMGDVVTNWKQVGGPDE